MAPAWDEVAAPHRPRAAARGEQPPACGGARTGEGLERHDRRVGQRGEHGERELAPVGTDVEHKRRLRQAASGARRAQRRDVAAATAVNIRLPRRVPAEVGAAPQALRGGALGRRLVRRAASGGGWRWRRRAERRRAATRRAHRGRHRRRVRDGRRGARSQRERGRQHRPHRRDLERSRELAPRHGRRQRAQHDAVHGRHRDAEHRRQHAAGPAGAVRHPVHAYPAGPALPLVRHGRNYLHNIIERSTHGDGPQRTHGVEAARRGRIRGGRTPLQPKFMPDCFRPPLHGILRGRHPPRIPFRRQAAHGRSSGGGSVTDKAPTSARSRRLREALARVNAASTPADFAHGAHCIAARMQ